MAVDAVTAWPVASRRSQAAVAPVLAAASAVTIYAVCVAVSIADSRSGIGAADYVWFAGWMLCSVCGGVLARSALGRRYGWFLIGVGLCAESEGVLGLILHLTANSQWPSGVLAALSLAKSAVDVPPQTLLLTMGLLLFPNGRLWSDAPRWRWLGRATVAATVLLIITQLITPGLLDDTRVTNPIGIDAVGSVLPPIELVAFVVLLGCLAVGVYAMAIRWRHGDPVERRAVAVVSCAASWVLLSVLAELILSVLHESAPSLIGSAVEAATIAALPVAALTTTVRRTMFDVDLALNRNLTYLALTVIVIGGYALTVTLLGRLFEHRSEFGISLVVTGLIAVLFGPLKLGVQQGVGYLLLGRRATPYRALTTLGRRLDSSLSPTDALSEAVRTVAETFRLPHVVLSVDIDGEAVAVARHGDAAPLQLEYPLINRGHRRGTLQLAPRTTFEKLTGTDERLLADFMTQIVGAVEAVHLTEQLRHSRTAVVLASEDERRRIRRELHDGIGPVLASTALAVQRVERQLDVEDPRRSLLSETRADVQHAIDDIRRVVHGLRPAALDELGLHAAISQRAQALSGDVRFDVNIRADLVGLPAAVEVVLYRVVTEAMTNVVRHAAATTCTVEVERRGHELMVCVVDDGRGLDPDGGDGIGLHSMRERVAELGGDFAVRSDERGTEVRACLPLS